MALSRQRGEESDAPVRGTVTGLANPRPLIEQLPGSFQEDDFTRRMVSALDDVLAPVFNILDCLPGYLDPKLAPQDFVEWLAGWVGVDIDETWTIERRRELIQDAVVLYRIRGTGAGLSAHVRLYCGVSPEVEDSGGCTWSQTANNPLPGSPQPHLKVRLRVDDASGVRRSTVSRIVDANRPAHIPFDLEIIEGGSVLDAGDDTGASDAAADAPGAVALPGSERIELAPQGPPSDEEMDAPEVVPPTGEEPPD